MRSPTHWIKLAALWPKISSEERDVAIRTYRGGMGETRRQRARVTIAEIFNARSRAHAGDQ